MRTNVFKFWGCELELELTGVYLQLHKKAAVRNPVHVAQHAQQTSIVAGSTEATSAKRENVPLPI